MKDFIVVFTITIVLSLAYVSQVRADSNKMLKHCLAKHGYSVDKFETFDFSKPAKCHSDYRVGVTRKQLAEMREFLKKNPWFTGTNWKWEETAEYTCKHVNTLQGSAVICQKPYYIN